MLVRNSWEHPRPSSKAVPEPLPPQHCPTLPQTRGDLLPRFSLEQGLEFENRLSDLRLPSCEESLDRESRNYFGQRNYLDLNLRAAPVEGHRELNLSAEGGGVGT